MCHWSKDLIGTCQTNWCGQEWNGKHYFVMLKVTAYQKVIPSAWYWSTRYHFIMENKIKKQEIYPTSTVCLWDPYLYQWEISCRNLNSFRAQKNSAVLGYRTQILNTPGWYQSVHTLLGLYLRGRLNESRMPFLHPIH